MLKTIPVLPLDVPADADYGSIRSKLEAAGQTIGLNDLFIAAHYSALGLTLVTDNLREFNRIRGAQRQELAADLGGWLAVGVL